MPRPAKLGILLLLGMAGLLLVLPFALTLPRPPSTLYVHIDGLDWTNVTVQSSNLPQPQRFDRSAQDVRVYPVSHGVYRIGVQLADGQSVWSKFFHYDAGVRQRVDVFLAPSSKPGCIHFRETANQKDLLFRGGYACFRGNRAAALLPGLDMKPTTCYRRAVDAGFTAPFPCQPSLARRRRPSESGLKKLEPHPRQASNHSMETGARDSLFLIQYQPSRKVFLVNK